MAEAVGRLPEGWGARCEARGSQAVKGKGVVEVADVEATVKLIKRKLPELAEALIAAGGEQQ